MVIQPLLDNEETKDAIVPYTHILSLQLTPGLAWGSGLACGPRLIGFEGERLLLEAVQVLVHHVQARRRLGVRAIG